MGSALIYTIFAPLFKHSKKNEADEFLLEATLLGVEIGTIKFTPQGENLLMTETSPEEGTETAILIPSESSYDDYCN